jgi:hypothetical protein
MTFSQLRKVTTVTFRRARDKVQSLIVIGPKTSIDPSKLPYSLPSSMFAPFALEKGPSHINVLNTHPTPVNFIASVKIRARGVWLSFALILQEAAKKHVPAHGDLQVMLAGKSKEEAYAAGIFD